MASNKVLVRNEVPEKLTWRLEDIFATDALWEEEYKEVSEIAKKASSYAGTLKKWSRCFISSIILS